jgi:hypothetical protein
MVCRRDKAQHGTAPLGLAGAIPMLRAVSAISLLAVGVFAAGVATGLVCREPIRRAVKSTMKTMYRASQELGQSLRDEFEDARAEVDAEREAAGQTSSR